MDFSVYDLSGGGKDFDVMALSAYQNKNFVRATSLTNWESCSESSLKEFSSSLTSKIFNPVLAKNYVWQMSHNLSPNQNQFICECTK